MLSLAQFRSQRPAVRSLIFLFWIYAFVGNAVNVFLQIYIYQLFSSVTLNIAVTMLGMTGIMIGFCVFGLIAAQYRLNIRHGFVLGFLASALGIVLLSQSHSPSFAALAMFFEGIGTGLFWLTIHTYELTETRDHERDVYSTYLSAGDQIVSLAGPAFATVMIGASHLLGWDEFSLLFMVAPPMYLLGLFFFGALLDYRPAPVRRYDVRHFFTNHRNRVAQVYIGSTGASHILQQITYPLVSIVVLGTALGVGGFNTVFALVSTCGILIVGSYRHSGNRLAILAVTALLIAALYIYLGLTLTIVGLIVFTMATSILQPLMRVSQHVIDLKTMDSAGHSESDFYPTMIFRDFSLWFWRMIVGGLLLILVQTASSTAGAISIALYATAAAFVLMYIGAYFLVALQPEETDAHTPVSSDLSPVI